MDKTREHEDLLKDRKVFILLGDTGVGKSTTIYFLSGQPMIEKKLVVG